MSAITFIENFSSILVERTNGIKLDKKFGKFSIPDEKLLLNAFPLGNVKFTSFYIVINKTQYFLKLDNEQGILAEYNIFQKHQTNEINIIDVITSLSTKNIIDSKLYVNKYPLPNFSLNNFKDNLPQLIFHLIDNHSIILILGDEQKILKFLYVVYNLFPFLVNSGFISQSVNLDENVKFKGFSRNEDNLKLLNSEFVRKSIDCIVDLDLLTIYGNKSSPLTINLSKFIIDSNYDEFNKYITNITSLIESQTNDQEFNKLVEKKLGKISKSDMELLSSFKDKYKENLFDRLID